jgi:serine protease AprX
MREFDLDRRRFVQAAGATGLAAALPTTAGATPVQAALTDDIDRDGGPQELVVVFDSNERVDALDRFDLVDGYHAFEVLPIGYTVATGEQAQKIAALDSVIRVQPNRELEFHNAEAREVTGVESVQRDGVEYTGDNTHVAVIDSGLSNLHPDHRGDVEHNYKYQNPLQRDTAWTDVKPADTDDNGHGSHVSGTVAGNGFYSTSPGTVTGEDQRGMAPDATLTVYSTGLTLAVLNSIAAFDHILANHTVEFAGVDPDEAVDLTNNSYGPVSGNGADFDPMSAMNIATYRCYDAGVLSFFSAGNSGPASNTYSAYAKAPWIVGVGATNDQKDIAGFSSRGRTTNFDGETNYDRLAAMENVESLYAAELDELQTNDSAPDADADGPFGVYRPDLAATGVSIVSTMSPNDPLQPTDNDDNNSLASPYYAAISGTSMSSPTATGATALVVDAFVDQLERYPTPDELFLLLDGPGTNHVDDQATDDGEPVDDHVYGKGFIDVRFADDVATVFEELTAEGEEETDEEETTETGDGGNGNAGGNGNGNAGGNEGSEDNAGGNEGSARGAERAAAADQSYGF